jgi:heterodisulfide reductase subunit C
MAEKQVPKFYEEVTSKLGGETLTKCYQCGTCASSCPVARITTRFNPRIIIKNSIAGERESVVADDPIWLCCSCYNCQERCPQEVAIAEVIFALRNIAIAEGHTPKIFVEMATNLLTEGLVVPTAGFTAKRRETMGLPPLKEIGLEPLQKILSATSFDKIVAKAKEIAK